MAWTALSHKASLKFKSSHNDIALVSMPKDDLETTASTVVVVNPLDLDKFCVQWEPDDPRNPMNWSWMHKCYITLLNGLFGFASTFASSSPSGIAEALREDFNISTEVTVLVISLFVAGYCIGPFAWGPLSENYGRRPIFLVCFLGYTFFHIAMALAKNAPSLLAFRFIGGLFAAGPLSNSPAVLGDIFDPKTRGKALAVWTLTPLVGPTLGPIVGGYISSSGTSWTWLFWATAIFGGVCLLLIIFTSSETYTPVLLAQIAEKKRKATGDVRYFAPIEQNKLSFGKQMERILARPFAMLFHEPMLIACTIYMSFVYACLYLLFQAYPAVFTEGYQFDSSTTGLMFLPILAGGLLADVLYIVVMNPRYAREAIKLDPYPVPPEFRLEPVIIAAPIFAMSFFWFGWTSFPSISYWAPMMAGLPLGFSIIWIFLGLFNYIIDTYLFAAASAMAASTVVRSLFGAGFPLLGPKMYEQLDPRWASSPLGFISIVMIPIPVAFIRYGEALRSRSTFAARRPQLR